MNDHDRPSIFVNGIKFSLDQFPLFIEGKIFYLHNPRMGHVIKSEKVYTYFDTEFEARMFLVNHPGYRYVNDYSMWSDVVLR